MNNKIYLWVRVLVWMGVIFLLSSRQSLGPQVSPLMLQVIFVVDHIVVYAILYLLSYTALNKTFKLTGKQLFMYSIIIVLLYGISDEYHQSFVPGRQADPWDVVLNLIGGIVAELGSRLWISNKTIANDSELH